MFLLSRGLLFLTLSLGGRLFTDVEVVDFRRAGGS